MIQVINRALDVLEYVAVEPDRPKALGEIADALGLNHGTCANIIKTLIARRYLEQIGTKKGYLLGAKSYALTGNEGYLKDLLHASRPEMDQLTEQLNENCLLAVLRGNQRVVIYRTSAEQDLQVRTADEKHVYDSASGRMLLAMLADPDLERFIAKYGWAEASIWPEATTASTLWQALMRIRKEECALQTIPGRQVVGIAVPVRQGSKVIASLSIYLPEYRYMAADKGRMVQLIRQTADRISSKLR